MVSRNGHFGFTLVEVLLSLAILAMLLAAVAVAVEASLTSFRENEDLADVTQTIRTVLNRISRDIRTAQAVDWDYTTLSIIPADNGSGITNIEYENDAGQLVYRITIDGVQTSHVFIPRSGKVQVSSFDVVQELGQDYQGVDCTKSITIRLVLDIDGKSFPATATASPRRNQLY